MGECTPLQARVYPRTTRRTPDEDSRERLDCWAKLRKNPRHLWETSRAKAQTVGYLHCTTMKARTPRFKQLNFDGHEKNWLVFKNDFMTQVQTCGMTLTRCPPSASRNRA